MVCSVQLEFANYSVVKYVEHLRRVPKNETEIRSKKERLEKVDNTFRFYIAYLLDHTRSIYYACIL